MAELALTFAQRAATSVAQGFAARAISSLLAKRQDTGARLDELHVLSSTDGAPMPIPYGRVRLGGQVIWVDQPVEHQINSRAGGKGGPRVSERKYTVSFAVGLCEGVIDGVGRMWADGALHNGSAVNMRVYLGDEDQLVDPLIETKEGSARAPAFRGLAYIVFEGFALEDFGNRIPQISIEVFRTPKGFGSENVEEKIRGVSLIPGSGEFIYATEPVITNLGPGKSVTENVHSFRGRPDVDIALDDLQTHLPNCDTVSLVISWFGDDLRCGNTRLQPAVETDEKQTVDLEWMVQELTRTQVPVVSKDALDRPIFGGTPSDNSVLQTIASLKIRALEVVFYPFVLMDIPEQNGLADPYGAPEQAAFPWRGRITCFPAPDQAGTVDKSANVIAQIDNFFGTANAADFQFGEDTIVYNGPNEWSYRRFILHYAKLCALAGGVDAFIIGSELRALTLLRDGVGNFPSVAHLRSLAAEVRAILPDTKISYAADWSEYFGYQPADGSNDVLFNLDELWADANIDFVAIDWYVPLSDWREGNQHTDAGSYKSIYDTAYLSANIEGGEGYDWFYASDDDRQNQLRSPIVDGEYGKDWVFRYKDLRSWWTNAHFDRPGGIEATSATSWVPQSKPIWFTETGCPAVDKGANQPNVFFDAKSSESALPHFSQGRRDDFIQREYLNANASYWVPQTGNNPISSLYSGPMVDAGKILAWTWDARPFPQFPALIDVWADGPNWARGHWFNGRMGLSSLAALIQDVCWRAGVVNVDVSSVEGLVPGFVVTGPTDVRAALEALLAVYGVESVEVFDGLRFQHIDRQAEIIPVPVNGHVVEKTATKLACTMPDIETPPIETRIQFSDESADYQPASASARGTMPAKRRVLDIALPLVSDREFISIAARDVLSRAIATARSAGIALPPSFLAIEPGDLVRLDSLDAHKAWRVEKTDDAAFRELSLRAQSPASTLAGVAGNPSLGPMPVTNPGPPVVAVLDIPLLPGEAERSGPKIAAFSEPWNGSILISEQGSLNQRARLQTPAIMGEVLDAVEAGGVLGRWDNATVLNISLYGGTLSSASPDDVLRGANTLAIEHANGSWEVLQFQNAILTGADTYALSGLLRGIAASDDALTTTIAQNALWVLVDDASQAMPMHDFEIGTNLQWVARSANAEIGGLEELNFAFTFADRVSRLPSPVHLRAAIGIDGVLISWIWRARRGGDFWGPADLPLVSTPERYRFVVYSVDSIVWEDIVSAPQTVMTDTQIDALFPNGRPAKLDIGVAQISSVSGAGVEARQFVYI